MAGKNVIDYDVPVGELDIPSGRMAVAALNERSWSVFKVYDMQEPEDESSLVSIGTYNTGAEVVDAVQRMGVKHPAIDVEMSNSVYTELALGGAKRVYTPPAGYADPSYDENGDFVEGEPSFVWNDFLDAGEGFVCISPETGERYIAEPEFGEPAATLDELKQQVCASKALEIEVGLTAAYAGRTAGRSIDELRAAAGLGYPKPEGVKTATIDSKQWDVHVKPYLENEPGSMGTWYGKPVPLSEADGRKLSPIVGHTHKGSLPQSLMEAISAGALTTVEMAAVAVSVKNQCCSRSGEFEWTNEPFLTSYGNKHTFIRDASGGIVGLRTEVPEIKKGRNVREAKVVEVLGEGYDGPAKDGMDGLGG